MRVLLLGCLLGALSGCSFSNEELDVTERYWSALLTSNTNELKQVVSSESDLLHAQKYTFDDAFSYVNERGYVLTTIKRFCYPDVTIKTKVVSVDGQPRVEAKATSRSLIQMMSENQTPVRQDCHGFYNSPLSGKINGEPWEIKKATIESLAANSLHSIKISLHPEECDTEHSGSCTRPKLLLVNIFREGEGEWADLSNRDNITIHTPPSGNKMVTLESYRVTPISEGKKRLELSFHDDEQNYLSGFVNLDIN